MNNKENMQGDILDGNIKLTPDTGGVQNIIDSDEISIIQSAELRLEAFSKTLLILTFILIFFGHYLLMPLGRMLWGTHWDFNDLVFSDYALISLSSFVSKLTPVTFAVFFFIISKRQGFNPWIWTLLGYYQGIFSIVLMLLIIGVKSDVLKAIYSSNEKFNKLILSLVLVFIILYALKVFPYLLSIFMSRVITPQMFGEYNRLGKLANLGILFLNILVNVGLAFWVNALCKELKQNAKLWTILTLFTGTIAPILLYIYYLFKRKNTVTVTESV